MGCPCSAMWGGRSQGEGREGSRRRCFTEPSAAELQSRAGAGLPHPAPQQGAPRRTGPSSRGRVRPLAGKRAPRGQRLISEGEQLQAISS